MISLEEYKKYLIYICRYNIDLCETNIKKREEYLNKHYSDEYLNKIINDTYDFIYQIFESDTVDLGYCSFDTDEDNITGINLNITGGGYSDTIFCDLNGRLISKYILEKIFGKYFSISIKKDIIPFDMSDDIISFNFKYNLYLQGFPKNMKEIKETLFGKSKKL